MKRKYSNPQVELFNDARKVLSKFNTISNKIESIKNDYPIISGKIPELTSLQTCVKIVEQA